MPPRASVTRPATGSRGRGTASAGRGATAATTSGPARRPAAETRGKGDRNSTPRGRKRQQGEEEEDDDGGGRDRDGDEDMGVAHGDGDEGTENDEEEDDRAKIPPELLTRILHGFFGREETRITRDANAAVARYMDVFVREAIARAAVERQGGFLEVEDLEKIAPQLLMDL
ncbi:hypothetical protein VTH82DRAFT_8402 [Thermothelomyces myriococcoides]